MKSYGKTMWLQYVTSLKSALWESPFSRFFLAFVNLSPVRSHPGTSSFSRRNSPKNSEIRVWLLNIYLNYRISSLRCKVLSFKQVMRNSARFLLYNLPTLLRKMLRRRTEMYRLKLEIARTFPEVLWSMLRNFREQKKLQFSIFTLIILLLALARADKARESFHKILTRSRAVHLYD